MLIVFPTHGRLLPSAYTVSLAPYAKDIDRPKEWMMSAKNKEHDNENDKQKTKKI